jgi:hypothetical protein
MRTRPKLCDAYIHNHLQEAFGSNKINQGVDNHVMRLDKPEARIGMASCLVPRVLTARAVLDIQHIYLHPNRATGKSGPAVLHPFPKF